MANKKFKICYSGDRMNDSFSGMKNVDWKTVTNFVQIVKNFYQECPAVQQRSEAEVMKWRSDNEVFVAGPANFKPILQFEEAGIPEYLMKTIKGQNYTQPGLEILGSHCSNNPIRIQI